MIRTTGKEEKIGLLAMNKDLESLLELQRKTKTGAVAPLVDVPIKNFWLWPGKSYWAYVRREKIAVRQLELRKEMDYGPFASRYTRIFAKPHTTIASNAKTPRK